MADLQDMLRTQMRTRTSALPRGTQDFLPEQVVLRQDLLDSIAGVFRRHGAVPLDTPALVKSENQTNAFNDDPQQIFDLKKDGTSSQQSKPNSLSDAHVVWFQERHCAWFGMVVN